MRIGPLLSDFHKPVLCRHYTHGRPHTIHRIDTSFRLHLTHSSPTLIDSWRSTLPSKARPIGNTGMLRCSSCQRAGQLRRNCEPYRFNDHCRPPPDLIRSEQPGRLAPPLARLPFRGRWLGFALSRRETDGTRRPLSKLTLRHCADSGRVGLEPTLTPFGVSRTDCGKPYGL